MKFLSKEMGKQKKNASRQLQQALAASSSSSESEDENGDDATKAHKKKVRTLQLHASFIT